MQDIEKVKERIRELAGRPNSVTEGEIEQIVDQLGKLGYKTKSRPDGRSRNVVPCWIGATVLDLHTPSRVQESQILLRQEFLENDDRAWSI